MATKTTSKAAAKAAARKTTAAAKPAASKSKVVSKKKEPEPKAAPRAHAAPAKPAAKAPAAPATPPPAPAPRRNVASVSLIDKQPAHKKAADGEVKKKTTVLPPISRIRASLEAPVAPPKPQTPPPEPLKVEPAPEEVAAATDTAAAPPAEEEGKNIIHIKPPIIVKDLAAQLGIKNHVLIKELMELQVFANQNQTIEPDVATKIAETHG